MNIVDFIENSNLLFCLNFQTVTPNDHVHGKDIIKSKEVNNFGPLLSASSNNTYQSVPLVSVNQEKDRYIQALVASGPSNAGRACD